ncbi:MAG TPA: response regulator [Candidatus Eisenbacteria bacterium]|jgi:CheY-like chemotaxis protein|nr:response regulator [Candidatus Eisenbacteria bacterium]
MSASERTYKILVVDDDPFTRDIFRLALEKAGFKVVAAEDGLAGLKAAAAEKPDVIMLDLMMPKMDGFETLAKLKADPHTRPIPVIILSSMRQDEDVARAMKGGAAAYMKKGQAIPAEIPAKAREVMGLPPLAEDEK